MVVYFVFDRHKSEIKIGWTKNLANRTHSLQVGRKQKLELLGQIVGGECLEEVLHKYFRSYRKHGEWFCAKDGQIAAFINELNKATGGRPTTEHVYKKIGIWKGIHPYAGTGLRFRVEFDGCDPATSSTAADLWARVRALWPNAKLVSIPSDSPVRRRWKIESGSPHPFYPSRGATFIEDKTASEPAELVPAGGSDSSRGEKAA